MRRYVTPVLIVFFALLLAGCEEEVTGEGPLLDETSGEGLTSPSFFCADDPGKWITLVGEDFSPLVIDAVDRELDFDVEMPTVTLTLVADPMGAPVDEVFAHVLSSPPREEDGNIRWLDGSTLQFRVAAEMEFPPGVYELEVRNPNGESYRTGPAFGVLPRPTLESARPEATCVAQGERELVLTGDHFLVGDGERPQVWIDETSFEVVDLGDCRDLAAVFGGRQLCREVTARIDEASLEPGEYLVGIQNPEPAECENLIEEESIPFTVLAPPVVAEVAPTPICGEQLDYPQMRVDGEGFVVLRSSESYPTVYLDGRSYVAESAEGCEPLGRSEELEAERCSTIFFSLTAGDEGEGLDGLDETTLALYRDVRVENPEPVGCTSVEEKSLTVVGAPRVEEAEPSALCGLDGLMEVTLRGRGMLEIGGVLPTVMVGDEVIDAGGLEECTDLANEGETLRSCEVLTFEVDAQVLTAGSLSGVKVINPESAACESVEEAPLFVAAAPMIASAAPDGICEGDTFGGAVTLTGTFTYSEAAPLGVTVNGESISVDAWQGCEPVGFDDVQRCTGMEISIDATEEAPSYLVEVSGQMPGSCGMDSFEIERYARPVITAVIPERICSAGGTLQIQGENFSPEAQVMLDGVAASTLTVSGDGTTATAEFGGPLPRGMATLSFVNPGSCGADFETEIRIYDGPLPVFVDPAVTYDNMNTQVTIYAAGLFGGSVEVVELLADDGSVTSLDFTVDPNRQEVVQATIPAGLLAAGETQQVFGVRLQDNLACANEAMGLLTITNDLTVAIDSVTPAFGASDQPTAVRIQAVDPIDPDSGEVQFAATPRVYLTPSNASGNDIAREVQAIQFNSELELNGVVREGLPVGMYDLIVVNPDGAVGVLPEAFRVTQERPPLVDTLSPGSWSNGESNLEVLIEGSNFRDGLTVEVFCRDNGDTTTEDEALLTQPNAITVVNVTESTTVIEVDTNNLAHLSVCYLRLTNDDDSFDEYSPVTVTNPAGKFMEFNATSSFDTPRRGNVAFSGVASRQARFLYVVGGDDGEEGNAYRSGEFASLDRFGFARSFSYLPYDLPTGRTFSAAERIDDFVYLVAGSDEGLVTTEILRAQVLNPLDVPDIIGLDLVINEEELVESPGGPVSTGDGLEQGVYYYRVSAVYESTDPANPGGESLASEPQPLNIPLDGISVTISWAPPEMINHEIAEYRVYRSVEADAPYGEESLIGVVDADTLSFTDDGTIDVIAGELPLPLGALGMWHKVADLQTERIYAGVTTARNPVDPDQWHIYAIGGQDSTGDARADYEFITIDVNGPRDQVVTPVATVGTRDGSPMLLPSPRKELSAVQASESNASNVAMVPPQIFVFGGRSDTTTNTSIKVTTVLEDGHLDLWTTLSSSQRMSGGDRYGNASAVINNNLVYLGGGNSGQASDAGFHTEILCDINASCPPATIPSSFGNLSALGMLPRAWMGYTAFRGFFYLAGGNTTGGVPTNSVDYSVAGGAP